MVHKNVNIELVVKARRPETPGCFSVLFDRPRGFVFEAGDWLDLEIYPNALVGGKTYSLASSPTEPDLMITLREGMSPFKKALAGLRAGDNLIVTQYGNDYGFQLDDNRASVLIAGGVGIAPFRSMIKQIFDEHNTNNVQLIYLNQTDEFLFKGELDVWSAGLANLTINYIVTANLKRKDREVKLSSLIDEVDQQFYIAGPAGMVASTSEFLVERGVANFNIKVDSFDGY